MTTIESIRLTGRKDKDGDKIYWMECELCGLREYHKIKNIEDDVFKKHAKQGKTYYFSHDECLRYQARNPSSYYY
jgi:YHS domain-containing protein